MKSTTPERLAQMASVSMFQECKQEAEIRDSLWLANFACVVACHQSSFTLNKRVYPELYKRWLAL